MSWPAASKLAAELMEEKQCPASSEAKATGLQTQLHGTRPSQQLESEQAIAELISSCCMKQRLQSLRQQVVQQHSGFMHGQPGLFPAGNLLLAAVSPCLPWSAPEAYHGLHGRQVDTAACSKADSSSFREVTGKLAARPFTHLTTPVCVIPPRTLGPMEGGCQGALQADAI